MQKHHRVKREPFHTIKQLRQGCLGRNHCEAGQSRKVWGALVNKTQIAGVARISIDPDA